MVVIFKLWFSIAIIGLVFFGGSTMLLPIRTDWPIVGLTGSMIMIAISGVITVLSVIWGFPG